MSATRAPGGIALYAVTVALELALGAVRLFVIAFALYLALALGPLDSEQANRLAGKLGLAVVLAPVVLSVLALAGLPGGAALTRLRLGARMPSPREQQAVDGALALLPGRVTGPRRLLVVDDPLPNAFVLGSALYLHRGLIWDPALPGVLAHELGHLNALDARLALALHRLAPSERLALLLGGSSLRLLRPLWQAWRRHREHAADLYASQLGQAHTLAAFLEREQFFDLAVPFLGDRTHPYTEQRLARLARPAP